LNFKAHLSTPKVEKNKATKIKATKDLSTPKVEKNKATNIKATKDVHRLVVKSEGAFLGSQRAA
jgi:hypothetical protein